MFFFSENQKIRLSKTLNIDISGIANKAINQLYEQAKLSKQVNNAMFKAAYEPLKQAVNEGLGKTAADVKYGTPNYEFLKQLQTNTAVFAAFKNHAQIKEMVALLKDDNGNLRSKADFVKAAQQVDDKYKVQYLNTEYDTAVRQARAATDWMKALSSKNIYPNIEYLPSTAVHPREEHEKYYGIIRPIDDPIWQEILPPNGWGCHCRWRVTDSETTDIPDHLPPPQDGFNFNAGSLGQIFDLDNDYKKAASPKEQKQLIEMATQTVNADMAVNAPYVSVYKSKSTGTEVVAHPLAYQQSDFSTDLDKVRLIANSAGKNELPEINKIKILPLIPVPNEEIGKKQAEALREKLLPGVKNSDEEGHPNPDYSINGAYYDLKEDKKDKAGKSTIRMKINEARNQGANAYIYIGKNDYISEANLYDQINQKFSYKQYADFKMYLYYNGKLQFFTQAKWKAFYNDYRKNNPK